jgi:hypothetical protein
MSAFLSKGGWGGIRDAAVYPEKPAVSQKTSAEFGALFRRPSPEDHKSVTVDAEQLARRIAELPPEAIAALQLLFGGGHSAK